jgi:hypothetical protein
MDLKWGRYGGESRERGLDYYFLKLKQTITHSSSSCFLQLLLSFKAKAQRTFMNPMTQKLLNLVKELGKYWKKFNDR